VQTYKTIPNNKPDIIIHDNKKGTCVLIDFAISGDRNVIKKEAGKVLKYTDLIIEIHCMWNMKAKVIPVITEVTATISKSLRQYLRNIPGKHEIKGVQKNSLIGPCTHST
jgi:3-deoxy-D-manno-octulosonic acid (KDO) 8-phosphate synthase